MKHFMLQPFILITLIDGIFFSCGDAVNGTSSGEPAGDFIIKTIKTGKGTGSVEVGYFNKDSFPDIVVANTEDSSLAVFLNDGKGNFTAASGSPFFANRFPNDIAINDLDQDGIPDLFIANTEISMLTVLRGNGKGQFEQVKNSPFAVHSRPHTHGIVVADFNGDGHPDMGTDDWAENKILIIFGDGKGNFSNETFYAVGNRPYQRLRSADLDKDGKPDIVTTNLEGNNTSVLLGEGNGKFHEAIGSPYPCGDAPFGVAIGDVNGDGHLDLAIVDAPTITAESKGRDGLWILLGDGTGKFSTLPGSPFQTGKSPSRLAIGDLNGDGINDVVVTNYNDKSITIFYMDKKGLSSSKTIVVGNHPDGVAVHDMNGDGRCDILVGNNDDNDIMVLFAK